MTNNQLTQVNTDPVVLSFPVSTTESGPLETTTSNQGDLALLGTIQALSSVTEEVAPTETQDPTTEYTASSTEDTGAGTSASDTLSHRGLIGGSALSMSSLSLLDMQRYLLQISFNAMEQSWLSNELLNSTAQQQYSLSMDAADESYKAGIAQANSELTAAITSGISAAGTGVMAGRELSTMAKESSNIAKYKAEETYFQKPKAGEPAPERPPLHGDTTLSESAEIPDAHLQLKTAIKNTLIHNRGSDISAAQQRSLGATDADIKAAKDMYDMEKIKAIDDAMKSTGPGTLNTPEFTNKYGNVDIYHDPIAQYGLRKSAYDMNPGDFGRAQGKLQGFHEAAGHRFTESRERLTQGSTILREAMDSIKNGIQSQFAREQAEHKKTSDEENALASLYKSVSDQFSALQGTWGSLNSKYYDQAMSLLPNQMAALVKANSVN